MKKIFKLSILLLFVLVICTACEGDVTRALRHEGFSVGGEFVCDAFFDENYTDKIKYLTASRIITTSGRIYEVNLGQKFSNNANCKVADTSLKVVSIFDDRIFKADDGKLYTLNEENNANAFTEVTSADNSYAIYQLLLEPEGTIKAMTADSGNGIYYVLKSDGNVYGITISQEDRNAPPIIVGSVLVYSRDDYGSNIVDFGYHGDNATTFVRTENKVFHMSASNRDECSKYADIPCNYQMVEATVFEEYKDYILVFNGSTVITTYKRVFSMSG
ncbi:MAG: hypothetical protein J6X28_03560 [Bacilli bacterium]|nr:hypothetical protein [Bacilli bacterium]